MHMNLNDRMFACIDQYVCVNGHSDYYYEYCQYNVITAVVTTLVDSHGHYSLSIDS